MGSQFLIAGGRPLTLGGKLAMLIAAATTTAPPPVPTPAAPMPTAGMSGWWDASTLVWGQTYQSLPDKSPAGKALGTWGSRAFARTAGLLGGMYLPSGAPNYVVNYPLILDYQMPVNSVSVGAGQSFTVFLVWSRAHQRQPQYQPFSTTPAPLIDINGTTVLSMTGQGDGNDVLTLFPAGTPQTGGKLELRHTHSLRLVFSGATVDVWLDGAKVITGAANQITLGATANLSLLNTAHCIFHEAACWSHALLASEHADLSGYAQRWPLGPRRAINGVLIGQSNAAKMVGLGTSVTLSRKIAYLTGCLSSNLLLRDGSNGQITGGATIFSGQGLYDGSSSKFLDNTSGGTAATWPGGVCPWPLGTNGLTFKAATDSLSADQRANCRYLAWFWGENDSLMLKYSMKATYFAAMKKAFSLIRGMLGMTAEQLPILVVNIMPIGMGATDVSEGCQTHREVMQDLVNDLSQNCHFMLKQSDDVIGEGDSWDSTTGLESGPGNSGHRDDAGETAYAHRFGIPIARAALAAQAVAGTPDVLTALDASIPQIGGPSIASAHYEGTTYAPTGSYLVTVEHDKGTDLSVPLRGALGVGWVLMDGLSDTQAGNPGNPGALIRATACTRIDSSHLRVICASLPTHPTRGLVYYNYGTGLDSHDYTIIGQGNAVIDNFASVSLPYGWQIGADMNEPGAQPNFPLHATTYGIALT